jgi:hypothetical protein
MHSDRGTYVAPATYRCLRFAEGPTLQSDFAAVLATFRGKTSTHVFSPFTVDPVLAGAGLCMIASSRFGWHVCCPDKVLRFYAVGTETLSDPIAMPADVVRLEATAHATKVTCSDGSVTWLDRGKPTPPPRASFQLVNPLHVCCHKIAVQACPASADTPPTLVFTIYE